MPDTRLAPQPVAVTADPLWYKDAIIYQLHVKAFFDANDDGVGDFQGLTRKLDYLAGLGVTALWLLPFYPSPLRDDGYDIADYRSVNPAYGTMSDFRSFVREAHRCGIRVITELVVNHTSDQHPWFQRARRAKPGSNWRNFYVWSDTDQKFLGTRIIFLDTEKSNWAWDPVAQAYYWHRFYAHQPDLNFDNPRVERAVINVMRYWLDIGVDGMRLDAVPYLIEREGTINENLPETHEVLKRLRAALDQRYGDRMLLAEANQWPEDVLQYFGNGDECHMAFHFPLMPRIFMAVATEDRYPITDIMRQTPDIPGNCQWAIFLRNHDELTLEMVTDRERDYLWNHYAADKRMRLNLGIRRRLAPLMENDRRRMELLHGIMFSMPGTPVMYYGDEIGMGDNIFLGDRDGVRTPMQWSLDRNGGFSRADPAQLYLPPIMDPVYGYQSVNVEAQSRSPSSFLNWMKRLITVRKGRLAFGRGDQRFLYPSNRKVLAYLRSHGEETILCVFNLARAPQAVELDLAGFKGRVPVELFGRSVFPPIGDLPYMLTLPGHGFYWFLLDISNEPDPGWRAQPAMPELLTMVFPQGWSGAFDQHNRRLFENEILPVYLPAQRWFAGKGRKISKTTVMAGATLPGSGLGWPLLLIDVGFRDGEAQRYFLPLAMSWAEEGSEQWNALLPAMVARARRARAEGAVYDAAADADFALALVSAMADGRELSGRSSKIAFERTSAFARMVLPANPSVKRLGGEQSNSSILIDEYGVLKLYRRLTPGVQPEIEMARFLTEVAHFAHTPPLLGSFRALASEGEETALGVLFAYVRNQGSAWAQALNYLTRYLDEKLLMAPHETRPGEAPTPEATAHPLYLELAGQLGQRTAELHRALCPEGPVDADFAPEPITKADLAQWRERAVAAARVMLDNLARRRDGLPAATQALADQLLAERQALLARYAELPAAIDALKTRFHGDYHLGQVLAVQNDFFIIDFEGEPLRPIAERRQKSSPLRDVAGMLRSYAYASATALRQMTEIQPAALPTLQDAAETWRREVSDAFLGRYRLSVAGARSVPADFAAAEALIDFFTLEKAVYEVDYELAQRPQWVAIPLNGVLGLIAKGGKSGAA
jgi:maltose alpha-D-glucosyltransferase/alpha-amylase